MFPSLMAYLLFSHALKYVESSKGSVLSVTEPLAASLFSSVFLGEKFETLQILGVALALGGIVLLFYQQETKQKNTTKYGT
jgi:drug/metabolite transporter (DMT)-like permease